MAQQETITVQAAISASAGKAWQLYTEPKHIVKWNAASGDWHSPRAENNLKAGGTFNIRMEAKDGSAGFDFTGVYDKVKENELIAYTMDDGRKVTVTFREIPEGTQVTVTFQAEATNPIEMQRNGWQSILNNFKKYVEGS